MRCERENEMRERENEMKRTGETGGSDGARKRKRYKWKWKEEKCITKEGGERNGRSDRRVRGADLEQWLRTTER